MTTLLLILLALDVRNHPCNVQDETLAERVSLVRHVHHYMSGPGVVAGCCSRLRYDKDGDCDVDMRDVWELYLMLPVVSSPADDPCG